LKTLLNKNIPRDYKNHEVFCFRPLCLNIKHKGGGQHPVVQWAVRGIVKRFRHLNMAFFSFVEVDKKN